VESSANALEALPLPLYSASADALKRSFDAWISALIWSMFR